VTAATCWSALAIQFVVILNATQGLYATGGLTYPVTAAIIIFFSFLTLQINLFAAVVTTLHAIGVRVARAGRTRSAIAGYMIAGSIVFALVLQPVWNHRGLQLALDVLLHGATPLLYGAFWLFAVPKDQLRWRDPFIWLIYPALYAILLLMLARWDGFYPYPFIDVRLLGFPALAFNLAALGTTFLTIGLATVALARMCHPPKA
jgi:hypothetical protein